MELNLPDGYVPIKKEELHDIKRFAKKLIDTKHSFFIFSRKWNDFIKSAENVIKIK